MHLDLTPNMTDRMRTLLLRTLMMPPPTEEEVAQERMELLAKAMMPVAEQVAILMHTAMKTIEQAMEEVIASLTAEARRLWEDLQTLMPTLRPEETLDAHVRRVMPKVQRMMTPPPTALDGRVTPRVDRPPTPNIWTETHPPTGITTASTTASAEMQRLLKDAFPRATTPTRETSPTARSIAEVKATLKMDHATATPEQIKKAALVVDQMKRRGSWERPIH